MASGRIISSSESRLCFTCRLSKDHLPARVKESGVTRFTCANSNIILSKLTPKPNFRRRKGNSTFSSSADTSTRNCCLSGFTRPLKFHCASCSFRKRLVSKSPPSTTASRNSRLSQIVDLEKAILHFLPLRILLPATAAYRGSPAHSNSTVRHVHLEKDSSQKHRHLPPLRATGSFAGHYHLGKKAGSFLIPYPAEF